MLKLRYGFVVFRNVISDGECALTRREIWSYLEKKVCLGSGRHTLIWVLWGSKRMQLLCTVVLFCYVMFAYFDFIFIVCLQNIFRAWRDWSPPARSGFREDDPNTWKKLSETETGRYYDACLFTMTEMVEGQGKQMRCSVKFSESQHPKFS